jgi:hypothetical protein
MRHASAALFWRAASVHAIEDELLLHKCPLWFETASGSSTFGPGCTGPQNLVRAPQISLQVYVKGVRLETCWLWLLIIL